MKIFFVNAVCGTGSTGRMIADLTNLLRAKGDKCRVAFGVGASQKVLPEEAVKMNSKAGYYFHNALSRLTDHTGLYSKHQTKKLVQELDQFDPDIVHLHNLHGYYINYEILFRALKKRNKPVVWTLHDCWAMTGHCTHYVMVGCEQWKTGCKTCPLLREYPVCYTRGDVKGNYLRKQAAFTSLSNLTIVTPSEWLAKLTEQSFLGKNPIRMIHNGINTTIFCSRESDFREKYGLLGKKIVLGVASVWSNKKGLDDFYRLAQRLSEQYQLVLVGLTKEQLQMLPDNILGVQRTENAIRLAEIYSTADAFANPTYADTFPTVNLEAQACGTPVISYEVCGCPETIQPGCGETVPCGDVDAMLEKILYWCEKGKPIPINRDVISSSNCYMAYYDLYKTLIDGA